MTTISLNGEWKATQAGTQLTVQGTVPGCIHTDLLAAGTIKDPFYRTQEFDAYWVGESDWVYTRRFTVPRELLSHDRVELVCHGLDTLATIRVNNREIAGTDNMFRTWRFDVKSALKAGTNTITIRFASALEYTVRKQAERHLPGWNNNEKIGYHGYIRKEQCNFGWDWGIRTVTCGIWRDIELVGSSLAKLADVRVTQDHTSRRRVDLAIDVVADLSGADASVTADATDGELHANVVVTRKGKRVAQQRVTLAGRAGRGAKKAAGSTGPGTAESVSATASLMIRDPELWWPNTMGDQPLYEVAVTLTDGDGTELDSWIKRIGLRTLKLDRHADQWGESFQFLVNGTPFFAKGANWIPGDAYNDRMTPERYRDLIASTADANMNMLRVWGGGLYEEDVFYDLCDEYGICIWQDFMFACYAYPTYDDEFVANVEQEAIDNIKRLRDHACMALWCGNNELEQGLVGPEWTERTMSWDDYARVFDKLLPELVAGYDGQTDYWPGSPHSPCGDRADHRNPTCGDAHLWDVWHGKKPFEWYRTCEHRFNSEFGFQSFPEPRTTYGYTASEDRNVTSYVMEHHQRSGIGNSTIMHYMLDWFRLPSGFDETLWTSQILQGMAIKYAVEHWRRSMPRGMGTIYWQLNDTWPVASWSSIDYHHRWKALHYMARKFFAPLLLSGVEDAESGNVDVHVTNDGRDPRELRLVWTMTDAKGRKLETGEKTVKSGRTGDKKVHTLRLRKLLDRQGDRDLLVWLEAYEGRTRVGENLVTFARPKHLELATAPDVVAAVKAARDGRFLVTLKSKALALWTFVGLVHTDFRADDNFVHVRPGGPVTLSLKPAEKLTLAQMKKELRVKSLADLG